MSRLRTTLVAAALMGSATALQYGAQQPLGEQQAPLVMPLVDSDALQDSIKAENLMARAEKLYAIAKLGEDEYNHPTRVIGSEGHWGTLNYIYETISKLSPYYTLSNQTFPAVSGNVFESRLVLGNEVPSSAEPMSLTPPTKGKQPVHGDLVLVANDGCSPDDYPAEVKSAIALIRRGSCSFGAKSELAGKAGAVAAVIYNNEHGAVRGTLGAPSKHHVATFGLSSKDAKPLIHKLEKGKTIPSIAYIDAVVEVIKTHNILAQTVGGDPNNCVMLGGHSDSVAEGPGINDDGSGTLSLLEVATQLTKFSVNNCVRFAWWAGEEEGLLGSDYYVAALSPEENQKIRLFMDYDMMASPNYAYQIYDSRNDLNPVGSGEVRDLYVDWYTSHGYNYTFIPFDGRSDYDAFIRNGIPGAGVATGAEGVKTEKEASMFGGKAGDWYDPCYHQLCDDVGNLNVTAWVVNTKLIAHSVATYARSLDHFPKRTLVKSSSTYGDSVKYHGHKLLM